MIPAMMPGGWIASLPDPYFANVVLLMHMDGTHGGSTWTDEKGHTGTNIAGINSSTQVKFGTTSRDQEAGEYVITHADMALGAGDFCVEGFFWTTTYGNSQGCYSNGDGVGSLAFGVNSDTDATMTIYCNGAGISSAATFGYSAWHHLALVRNGSGTNNLRLYYDGTNVVQGTDTRTFSSTTMNLGRWYSGTYRWIHYIDDFRITVGVPRYTANFSPPTRTFPNS